MSEDRRPASSRMLELSGLGMQLAITVTLGVLGGLWLDERCGTTPLFTLLGSFGALAAVFYQLIKIVDRFSEN